MSAFEFEITTPWGQAVLSDTSEEARRALCVDFFAERAEDYRMAVETYDALTAQERFALWRMLEGMGAKMRRVPVPGGAG